MATVGITKELIDRTINIIDKMRRGEIATDVPNYDKNFQVDAAQLFHQGCWGKENLHLINQIPKDWLAKVENADVYITGTIDVEGTPVPAEHKTNIRFNGLSAYARPADSYWNKTGCTISINDIEAMPSGTAGRSECIDRWRDAVTVFHIDARWAKIKEDIKEFLGKCKSLNEAVKLYPGIKMYIDRYDIERLERKVERMSQRKKIVETMATDELTAAAMAARLTGAV